ncbi:MAG: DNA-3-methyladenine glycosylase 2 family protein [Desulfobacterales bacterium]|nr:DNA-3-methyladenine glycosylase [Deltaproteobacteria bacterium]NNL78022.1 DNA-3-methyladenine glycosylase 2 family protein [Desulfobacterales bacterium]
MRTPKEFDFSQCLKFLARSAKEPCHLIEDNTLYKLLKFDSEAAVLKIWHHRDNSLCLNFLTPLPPKPIRDMAAKYVWNWFDLGIELKPFYRLAKNDAILKHITKDFFGLRMITIIDLFEAISWAIIGQQINLEFAYTLKKRLVQSFGEKFCFDKKVFYLFPTPQVISERTVGDLKRLQLTGRKSEYLIELALKMKDGGLTKKALLEKDGFGTIRTELMQLRGVGKWTAEYVCLRCLKDPAAFPVDDVGLQNAVMQQLGLSLKPTADEILRYSSRWDNWQAYAAFFLWRSLIGNVNSKRS